MSEQQVRELAERLERADEEQHEESLGAMPADPYEVLAREVVAYVDERRSTRPAAGAVKYVELHRGEAGVGYWYAVGPHRETSEEARADLERLGEQAPVTPSEPAPPPEATQVADEPAGAATAATERWRGKRWVVEAASDQESWSWRDDIQAWLSFEGEDPFGGRFCVLTMVDDDDGLPAAEVARYIAHLHNAALDRSAALPRERLASRWAELQAEKEQLSRTVNFLVDRLAALRPEARETARLLAQTAIERNDLRRRCKWAAGELRTIVNDHAEGVAAVLSGVQPVPGGEEGQDG